jgi:serine/threonine protein phosphatase 1
MGFFMPKLERFAKIEKNKRIWAIPSVHGEAERLRVLHQSIAKEYRPGDKVVYLGNLIGVGDKVKETVNEFLLFRRALISSPDANVEDVICIRGMQEEMWNKLMQLHYAPKPEDVLKWMLLKGVGSVIKAYGGNPDEGLAVSRQGAVAISRWTQSLRESFVSHDGHMDYLTNLHYGAYTEDNKLLFVSAGYSNQAPITEQSDSLWWESKKPFEVLDDKPQEFDMVVRGYCQKHDKEKPYLSKSRMTLDMGCGFDGKLAACLFDERSKPVQLIAL